MSISLKKLYCIVCIVWICCIRLNAQDILDAPIEDKIGRQTFRAAPIVGINMSQVDGDSLAGYHKVGLVAGAYGQIKINQLFAVGIEALYSQKGSRANKPFLSGSNIISSYSLSFNYAEVPITLRYTDRYIHFYAGGSLAQMLNYKEVENGVNLSDLDSIPFYKKQDYNYLIGIVFFPYKGIGIDLRYQRSFRNIIAIKGNGSQVNKLISLRLMYLF